MIKGLKTPDFVLIGESDPRAGDMLQRIYESVCESDPPVQRMNFVNAELTKIAVNTFVTTKISYANMLAEMCDCLPGADVDIVTEALGRDSRIGAKYLRGALGYGGPCFPRDNVAFGVLAARLGAHADIAEATDRINRYQIERLVNVVRRHLPDGGTVGILGLSYKPDTDVIEESQGVALAKLLADGGCRVVVFDPLALDNALAVFDDKVAASPTATECAAAADVVVITTAWPEFGHIPASALVRKDTRACVIDCWRILPKERYAEVADIIYLGHGTHYPVTHADDKEAVSANE